MSRLASLQGPSSPSPSPVKSQKAKANQARSSGPKSPGSKSPSSPSIYSRDEPDTTPPTESTYHRKLRSLLIEISSVTKTWNELVIHDGVKAIKGLTDARTELENALSALPPDTLPRSRIVTPKLFLMDERVEELNDVVTKLKKQFTKLSLLVENVEALLVEACRTKGWKWVSEEPLWTTWPLERFVSVLPTILPPYHRALQMCLDIQSQLQSHSITFNDSRTALRQWVGQPSLADGEWEELDQIFVVEVDRWKI
ncbi:hypothetical protein FRC02_002957 [Tulasnella sp. 418]|nr:hypothetical protein FRC02_002957 [Tulasnella sp. 418]